MGILQGADNQTSGNYCRENERTGNLKVFHQPVLLEEVLQYLNPQPNENFIDATTGLAGHSRAILEKNKPSGKVLGIELDKEILEIFKKEPEEKRLILAEGNFAHLKKIVQENNFGPVHGILFDLGFSSWQIEQSGRGFSFLRDEPLIMRYSSCGRTAQEIVNQSSEEELTKIFQDYGQERYSRRISRAIVEQRKIAAIKTTGQLTEIIRQAVPKAYQRGHLHFATRIFQALRIATNEELVNLEKALFQAEELLAGGGRIVIISFHSLEDRIVKNFFREQARMGKLKTLTKKPVQPTASEINLNRRARSAKLRAALRLG